MKRLDHAKLRRKLRAARQGMTLADEKDAREKDGAARWIERREKLIGKMKKRNARRKGRRK